MFFFVIKLFSPPSLINVHFFSSDQKQLIFFGAVQHNLFGVSPFFTFTLRVHLYFRIKKAIEWIMGWNIYHNNNNISYKVKAIDRFKYTLEDGRSDSEIC